MKISSWLLHKSISVVPPLTCVPHPRPQYTVLTMQHTTIMAWLMRRRETSHHHIYPHFPPFFRKCTTAPWEQSGKSFSLWRAWRPPWLAATDTQRGCRGCMQHKCSQFLAQFSLSLVKLHATWLLLANNFISPASETLLFHIIAFENKKTIFRAHNCAFTL